MQRRNCEIMTQKFSNRCSLCVLPCSSPRKGLLLSVALLVFPSLHGISELEPNSFLWSTLSLGSHPFSDQCGSRRTQWAAATQQDRCSHTPQHSCPYKLQKSFLCFLKGLNRVHKFHLCVSTFKNLPQRNQRCTQ